MDPAGRFLRCAGIYLLSHSVGRLPVDARAAVDEGFFQPWELGQGDPWPQWLAGIERFRIALGALFNTAAENFCPQTNLSSALTRIIGSLERPDRRPVLLFSEDDFPSMGFVIAQATRLGWKTRSIPRAHSVLDMATWDAHLTHDVALVLLTHVHSNTGRRAPVAEVLAMARERGVLTVVDVAQSAGVVPVDLDNWCADFVIGSCVKWLCGGPGAGWLWVAPEIVGRCRPLDVGWFSHEDPFEFAIHDFRYHPGALRFWGGTPSVLPFVLAGRSLELIAEIGIGTVHAHNRALTQQLIDRLDHSVLRSPAVPEQRGGTVVLDFAERQHAVIERLRSMQVSFDARASGIRLSPHIYNTRAEIDTVLECLSG